MGEKQLQAVRALSPAYAGKSGELTAILQYVFQVILLDGCGRGEQAKALMQIAVDEMRHLGIIGGLLVKMGVPPVFTACPPYPVAYYSASNVDHSRKFSEMLETDIRAEQEAIACYTRALDAVTDGEAREAIAKIRADEERHLALLRRMRSELQREDRRSPQRDPRA